MKLSIVYTDKGEAFRITRTRLQSKRVMGDLRDGCVHVMFFKDFTIPKTLRDYNVNYYIEYRRNATRRRSSAFNVPVYLYRTGGVGQTGRVKELAIGCKAFSGNDARAILSAIRNFKKNSSKKSSKTTK